jgi:hypothetical protein
LSPLDLDLAQIHCLLEKKYGNNDDSGFTYICGDDPPTVLQLTPFMMKEWAMSIVCKSHLAVSKIID